MNFRFTLHSELGAYILERDPIGWDKAEILFKRSPKYHGVFYEKNIDLTFYCGAGKEYIDQVIDELGIDTTVTIKIEIACGCEDVPDAPDYSIDYSDDYGSRGENSCTYEEIYLGKLDLKTWNTETGKSNVNIIQEGIADTIMTRLDTIIDLTKLETLDGTALTAFDYGPYDLTLHSKAIKLKSRLSTNGEVLTDGANIPHSDFILNVNLPIPLQIELDELDSISSYTNFYDVGTVSSTEPDPFFTATEAGVHNFSYNFDGQYSELYGQNRTYTIVLAYLINGVATTINNYGAVNPTAGLYTLPISESGEFSSTLSIGDTITFYLAISSYSGTGGDPDHGIAWIFNDGSFIQVVKQSTTASTTGKAFAVFEAGARIAQSITNQTDAFRSDYFGRKNAQPFASASNGCGSFSAITNGALIRNFPIEDYVDADSVSRNGRPVRISLSQYFDSLNAMHNLGMGVEKSDTVFYVRIEPKGYFYENTLLFQLSNVPELKTSIAPEYYYSKVNIGYEQWQVEQVDGLDEFNSIRQYDTGLKVIDNTLDAKSSLIASGYMLEVTRRKQYPDSFTEDDPHDNDNFIVCLNRSVDGSNIPTGLDTAEKDENFASVSNMLSPETSYNLRISPGRNMLRWSPVINAGLLKYAGREIKLTNGEGNFKMESEFSADSCPGRWNNNPFNEGQDIQWDDTDNSDSTPIWEPVVYTFKYPLNRTQAALLQANPYGYIEISERSTTYIKCFILEAKYSPVGGMTEFKLLKKWQ